jgi:hypothetical protein
MALARVSFPQHATPGPVKPAILRHLRMVFVPIVTTFTATAISVLTYYDIDRATLQRNTERRESADECDSGDELKMPPNKQPGIRTVS